MHLRQAFRLTSGVVVILILARTAAAFPRPERGASQDPAVTPSTLLQDQEASALGRKIDEILRKELTEHWYPHAVDRKRGGFHQNMARDWSLQPDENVSLVYQARMTWTAAAFAQYSRPHHDEYVKYARHGVEFLDRVMRDKEFGGFHWVLDSQGTARSQARRREACLWHGLRHLRRQQGPRGDRGRAGAQGRPRRIRLAGKARPRPQERRLFRGDPPRRNANPVLGPECSDVSSARPRSASITASRP